MAVTEFTTEELQSEKWRAIPGYEGYYSVSSLGRVRRDLTRTNGKAGRILRPDILRLGYKQIRLHKEGKSRRFKVHRLVLLAFVGASELITNHIDCQPSNNRLPNLEYVTYKGNMEHAVKVGHRAKGHDVNTSKLHEVDVLEIRRLLASGVSGYSLAKRYGISNHTIYSIRHRTIWKHL